MSFQTSVQFIWIIHRPISVFVLDCSSVHSRLCRLSGSSWDVVARETNCFLQISLFTAVNIRDENSFTSNACEGRSFRPLVFLFPLNGFSLTFFFFFKFQSLNDFFCLRKLSETNRSD